MTATQERVLRELLDCVDGRASGHATRLAVRISGLEWARELDQLEANGWVVEDRRAPGVIVITAAGSNALSRWAAAQAQAVAA